MVTFKPDNTIFEVEEYEYDILLNRLIFHSLNPNPKNGGFIKRLARVKSLTNRTGYS
jgi:hypothetical protein